MSIRRCAACGSPNVIPATEQGGYSYTKGAIGVAILGTGGAVAGLNGKTTQVYKCPDCGLTLGHTMPEEIRVLIDAGVNSAESRKKLIFRGLPMSWEQLRSSYKNIESGAADRQIMAELQRVTAKATATQQEFESAIDLLVEKLYRKLGYGDITFSDVNYDELYTKDNPITLQEYDEICAAIYTFMENMDKYLPLNEFGRFDDEYRYLPTAFIENCISDYCFLRYYELMGCLPRQHYIEDESIRDPKERFAKMKAESDFEILPKSLPFLKSWSKYVAPKTTVRSSLPEHYFYDIMKYTDFGITRYQLFVPHVWEIQKDLKVYFLVPRFKKENEKLYFSDVAFGYFWGSAKDTSDRMDEYFSTYPEKKEIFEKSIEERGELEKAIKENIKTLQTKIGYAKESTKERLSLETKIKENNASIEKLKKKLFGKKKAALEAASLDEQNKQHNSRIKELRQKESELDSLQAQLGEAKKSLKSLEQVWYENLTRKMDYFTIWSCADDILEDNLRMKIVPKEYIEPIKTLVKWLEDEYGYDDIFDEHLFMQLKDKILCDGDVELSGAELRNIRDCASTATNYADECGIDKETIWNIWEWAGQTE